MSIKKKQNKKQKKILTTIDKIKYINYTLIAIIVVLAIFITTYSNIKSKQVVEKKIETNTYKSKVNEEYIKNRQDKFEEYTKEFEKEFIEDVPSKKYETIDKKSKIEEPKAKKPKLAILIDDVSTMTQVKNINNIGYTVGMSFLPPTKTHPNSAQIAQNLPFHMIHFPLEAMSFKNEEKGTLKVGDSYEKIEEKVAQVRLLYPQAAYINNHTGSKFTADAASMDKLFRALKKYNFIFLDSRTTPKTLAKTYSKKYGVPFLSRNIFLDNEIDEKKILEQLKKAITYAKKHDYAIAIGHPYKETIKVLKNSKELFKDLDLVYIKDIPLESIE